MMLKVIQGHEIWVLPDSALKNRGEETRCRVYYGHAMRPDGLARENKLSAWAINPAGERFRLRVLSGREYHTLRLIPEKEGLWAVAVENDVGPIVVTKGGLYKPGTRKEYPDAREAAYY